MKTDSETANSERNPHQMMDLCKVNKFEGLTVSDQEYVTQILAAVVVCSDPTELRTMLTKIVQEIGTISIGRSLERLIDISEIGPELDGNCTGLDALCSHLSAYHCRASVTALEKVLNHFKD